jgi:hypothetical protein
MNKHFVKITNTYVPKNKLQEAISEAFKSYDGVLLEKKFKQPFLKELEDYINIINSKFKRCTPAGLEVFSLDKTDTGVYIEGVLSMSIYQVKVSA